MDKDTFITVWKNYRIPIILTAGSFFCIALSIAILLKSYQTDVPIEFSSQGATVSGMLSELVVDVQGAVGKPGVYKLPSGSRVDDAITIAGGLTEEADSDRISTSINRAAKLVDGAKLYIPKIGEVRGETPSGNLVSINNASHGQLENLSGIGPATAKKIIDNRPYLTLEELVTKKAIGQALYDKLKDQLTL